MQINLNYCKAAQYLLSQTIFKKDIDVTIIGELFRYHGGTWSNTLPITY